MRRDALERPHEEQHDQNPQSGEDDGPNLSAPTNRRMRLVLPFNFLRHFSALSKIVSGTQSIFTSAYIMHIVKFFASF